MGERVTCSFSSVWFYVGLVGFCIRFEVIYLVFEVIIGLKNWFNFLFGFWNCFIF